MDGVREFWAISRPSVGPAGIWMPAINNIDFEVPFSKRTGRSPAFPIPSLTGRESTFECSGSVTGEDGEGWSHERFVSRSKRAIIEPADWRIAWTLGYRKATLPVDFQVTWRSYPLFAPATNRKPTGTRTVLVQGCTNEAHTLTLSSRRGGAWGLPPSKFIRPTRSATSNAT